jgi:FtsP/CotA-like multicopper oxidase with cupredoxin domain
MLGPVPTEAVQAQGATVVYNLYATDGYIEMADGLDVYAYGFIGSREGVDFTYTTSRCTGDGVNRSCARPTNVTVTGGAVAPQGGPWTGQDAQFAGNAQFPAPIVYATVGDIVEMRLKNLGVTAQPNAPNDPHSIHLHGLDVDAANDGVPETSVGAVPANLCADGTTAADGNCASGPAPSAGNVIVYMFSPDHAGTYMYHCHQEADIHVNMGMFGALAVYNPGDAAAATGPGMGMGGNLYGVQYDQDYVLLLGEFDIRGHADEEGTYVPGGLLPPNSWDPDPFNWALYEPQYWFINGLSFPNTIHADFPSGYTFAEWLAAHPGYDPLITGSVSTPNAFWGTPGSKTLIRVINMGFETQPMHMPVGSGETFDWLIDFGQQSFNSVYPAGTQSCIDAAGNPVEPTDPTCVAPAFWEADVYIQGPTVAGLYSGLTPGATSQFFPFHNHDDYKATNDGVYPGGMFTMIVPTP